MNASSGCAPRLAARRAGPLAADALELEAEQVPVAHLPDRGDRGHAHHGEAHPGPERALSLDPEPDGQRHGGGAQHGRDDAHPEGEADVGADIEQGIQSARGGGQPLGSGVRAQMESGFGADFSGVRIETLARDRVAISGASGATAPETYKLTVAFDGGHLAEAGVSYAGPGAQSRAELAGRIVAERMRTVHGSNAPLRVDVIGAASLHATVRHYHEAAEDVRLHCAQRASSREQAELLLWEVESLLCCGPAGGGGYRGHITPSVITYSASLDRDAVDVRTEILVA